MSLRFPARRALAKLFFLRRERAFTSLLIHGWLNLLLVILGGTDDSSMVSRFVLMSVHMSSTQLVSLYDDRNCCWNSTHVYFISSKLALFHKKILHFTGFVLFATIADSTETPSWSDRPGIDTHLFMNLCRFVRNKSKVLLLRVGKVTICSSQQLCSISRNRWLMTVATWLPLTSRVSHTMSGRLRSPPNQSTAFLLVL